jgi:hypothetical protein
VGAHVTNEPFRQALLQVKIEADRYAQMAASIRAMEPKKMTTAQVQSIFTAIAMFFERAETASQESAAAIARILYSQKSD